MRIAVVGDILLDVDVDGRADRLSPDAPVPVVAVSETARRAGGAGLVATLLARDGHDVALVTVIGEDAHAGTLRRLLDQVGARSPGSISLVAGGSGSPTPVKTRVRAADHAVVRIDEGCEDPVAPEATAGMISAVEQADAVVVADYGRRLTSEPRLRAILTRTGRTRPLVWDPHPRGADPVSTASVVTPNLAEALAAAGTTGRDVPAAGEAARRLAERWGGPSVLVTLGERGALLQPAATAMPHMVPACEVRGVDTCGAGDRLAATLTAELAAGASLAAATQSAVAAVAGFLSAGGVAPLAPSPSGAAGAPIPWKPTEEISPAARATRMGAGTVVATGGCFDLLHAGHVRTLSAARALGDCLVVCLNSDASARRLKGPERPIMSQDDRRDLLLALECVDDVVIFDEDSPVEVLRQLVPDVWVKGGDYVAADLPEAAVLAEWGAQAVTVPYHPGRSTTRLAGALARVG